MTDDQNRNGNGTLKGARRSPKPKPPSKPTPATSPSSTTPPTAALVPEPSWLKELRTSPHFRVVDTLDFASVQIGGSQPMRPVSSRAPLPPTTPDADDDFEALVIDVGPETAESLEIVGGVHPSHPRTARPGAANPCGSKPNYRRKNRQ
jgi:hypothetical protein